MFRDTDWLRRVSTAEVVCAIGLYARSQLMKISDPALWGKIKVTPLGVDPSVFTPRVFRAESQVFDVICVGRLVPAKGQHVLLSAVARLLAKGRALTLRLVGDGPDRRSLEAAAQQAGIQDQVIFEGAINQDRIRDLFEKADVFALASFAEGIPVVLMEAMAMEIPCVSTWITGIPELIRDSIDGLLVAPSRFRCSRRRDRTIDGRWRIATAIGGGRTSPGYRKIQSPGQCCAPSRKYSMNVRTGSRTRVSSGLMGTTLIVLGALFGVGYIARDSRTTGAHCRLRDAPQAQNATRRGAAKLSLMRSSSGP